MRERQFRLGQQEWRVFDVVPLDQMIVSPELRQGWLYFEAAGGEHRRLSPIPRDWETATHAQLLTWLEAAVRVRPSPPRLRLERFATDE
jgi:hypothetical protein